MRTRTIAASLLVPIALLACGSHAVDLDSPVVVEPSSDPAVLGTVHQLVARIAVDTERVYWLGSAVRAGAFTGVALQSCQKRDCAETLLTYAVEIGNGNFSVHGGEIYWFSPSSLLACPIAGCNGTPRTVATTDDGFMTTAFDDGQMYAFTSDHLSSFSLSQAGPPRLIAAAVGLPIAVTVQDRYAYWLASLDDETLMFRVDKDASAVAEIFSSDVGYAQTHHFSLIANSTSVYWTSNTLAGSINRCPLAGCSGASETVLDSVRAPQKLLIDDATLYYVYDSGNHEYTLASCALPACQSPQTVIGHLDSLDALAVDDRYVYIATTEGNATPLTFLKGNPITTIRRLPKMASQ